MIRLDFNLVPHDIHLTPLTSPRFRLPLQMSNCTNMNVSAVNEDDINITTPIHQSPFAIDDSLESPYFDHDGDGVLALDSVRRNIADRFGVEPQPQNDGEGEDDYRFVLSDEEFLDLFLEDLELPDLAKRQVLGLEETQPVRAGYRSSGPPATLSVSRTMRNSLSRRAALGRPSPADLAALEAEIARLDGLGGQEDKIVALREELERKQKRMRLVPFIDPIDVRYRRYDQVPKPVARAVMFCLMDVSGSMDEHMKDLAKRFYALLYLFLKRRYKRVDVVFIRHTHEAKEVDEETFFHSRESGGTVVSTALEEMARVIQDRFPANQWNIYAAQASDGDNLPMDNANTVNLLRQAILPLCQYYAYLEVGHARDDGGGEATSLWRAYEPVAGMEPRMAMRKVSHRRDIYPVFRELFAKEGAKAEA